MTVTVTAIANETFVICLNWDNKLASSSIQEKKLQNCQFAFEWEHTNCNVFCWFILVKLLNGPVIPRWRMVENNWVHYMDWALRGLSLDWMPSNDSDIDSGMK